MQKELSAAILKKRIFIIITITLFVFFGILIFTLLYIQDIRINSEIEKFDNLTHSAIRHISQKNITRYEQLIKRIAAFDEIKTNIKTKDRKKLIQFFKPRWKSLKIENPYLKILHFHLPDGTSFLRIHKPEIFGDKLDNIRPMIKEVHKIKKTIIGYETGKYSTVYRIITPIFDNKTYLGAVEIGVNPDFLIDELEQTLGYPGIMLIKSSELKLFKHKPDLKLGEYTLQSETNSIILEILRSADKKILSQNHMKIKHLNKTYVTHLKDIKNFKNDIKVKMLFFQDTTNTERYKSIIKLLFSLFSLTTLILLLYIIVKQLNVFEKGLKNLYKEYSNNLTYLNEVFKIISNINSDIVKIKYKGPLLKKICTDISQGNIFNNVWIGLYDKNNHFYKVENNFKDGSAEFTKNLLKNHLPHCLKNTGQEKIVSIDNADNTCEECAIKTNHPNDSAVVIKLIHKKKTYGVLGLSISKEHLLDEKTSDLLIKISDDIAFALYSIESNKKRKHANKKLEESMLKMKSIFRASPIGIGVVSNRVFQNVNKCLCDMTGYSKDDLIGKNSRILYASDEEYEFVGKEKYRQIKEKGTGTVETQLICKDGSLINVLLSSTPLDHDNLSAGVTFTVLDVTKRKKAEKSKQESEFRLQEAQKLAHIGSWEYDIEAKKMFWSNEMYEIFNLPPQEKELSYRQFLKYVHPDDLKPLSEHEHNILKNKKNREIVLRIVLPNGDIRTVNEITEIILNDKEEPLKIVGTIQDVTKQKKIQDELKEKTKAMLAQSRHAAMGEMISMIAHQWRQPLAAISATTGSLSFKLMLEEKIDKELLQNEINLISDYSQHLSKTIDDFRGFFKEDKIKMTTTLDKLINDTLNITRVSIANKNIDININSSCKEKLETFPNEVKQVLINIIKNAEDALTEKNTENPSIEIDAFCKDENKGPTLVIKDNAGGIPDDILDKVFEPYFSTKLEKDGTGLGLYMSKIIIEDHCGGKIYAANDGKGAVFTIEFKQNSLLKEPANAI